MKWPVLLVLIAIAFPLCSCQPSPSHETELSATTAERTIRELEQRVETTLTTFEQQGELEPALDNYQAVEQDLLALGLEPDDPAYTEQQRVLAYTLLRQGNMLRQLGRTEEAKLLSEREIEAARASGDQIALARTQMSYWRRRGRSSKVATATTTSRGWVGTGYCRPIWLPPGWYRPSPKKSSLQPTRLWRF